MAFDDETAVRVIYVVDNLYNCLSMAKPIFNQATGIIFPHRG